LLQWRGPVDSLRPSDRGAPATVFPFIQDRFRSMSIMRGVRNLAVLGCALLLGACADLLSDPFEYGTIEVHATRRNGDPVAGANLTLFTGHTHLAYGTTGPDGRFVFRFVPMGAMGVYVETPDGYLLMNGNGGVSTLRLAEGEHGEVGFRFLKHGPGAVVVQASDPDGAALPGVQLQLYTGEGIKQTAVTDSAGRHRFEGVPLDAYGVMAFPAAGYVTPAGRSLAVVDDLLIDAGHVAEARFVFRRCLADLVVRAQQPSGAPVPDVGVLLYTGEGVQAEARTDAQGRHEFTGVTCGRYGVRIQAPAGYRVAEGRGSSFIDGIELGLDDRRTIEFAVPACRGRIRGRVVDQADAPVAGASLTLYTPHGVQAVTYTDAAGEFAFEAVGCGADYAVLVVPPTGYTVVDGRGTSIFDGLVIEPGSDRALTFRLTRS
jgi:hypothetical protein